MLDKLDSIQSYVTTKENEILMQFMFVTHNQSKSSITLTRKYLKIQCPVFL